MYCECVLFVCVLLSEIEKMYPRVHRKWTEISTTGITESNDTYNTVAVLFGVLLWLVSFFISSS